MNLPYLQSHSPDVFVSSCRPFKYDPDAQCPLWMEFIDFFTSGDTEVARTLQQWFASVFLPYVRHECFLWLCGKGANGKSVLIEVLRYVLGEEIVGTLSVRQLTGKHELAGLADKKINISMEFEGISKTFIDAVKNLTSNEPVTINEKNKPVYSAKLGIRVCLVNNSIVYVKDQSDGFWRRCLLVECLAQVTEGEKNLNLIEELKAEAPGIFNWLISGAVDLTKNNGHIFVAKSIEKSVAKQRRVMDPHKIFLTEELAICDHGEWLPGDKELYPRYRDWMKERGHSGVLSWESFKVKLKDVYPHVKSVRRRHLVAQGRPVYGYSGIDWKDVVEAQERAATRAAEETAKRDFYRALKKLKEEVHRKKTSFRGRLKSEYSEMMESLTENKPSSIPVSKKSPVENSDLEIEELLELLGDDD